MRNFARSWALDVKDRGIRVNVVSPGPVRTPGLGDLVPEDQRQGLFDALAAQVPLGRLGEPGEIGQVVAFLASDASSFVNATDSSWMAAWRRYELRVKGDVHIKSVFI